MKTGKLCIILSASLTALLFAVGAGYKIWEMNQKIISSDNSRMVKLFKVTDESNASKIIYPGRIEANEHANLFFRVSGPVVEHSLKLGDVVEKGEIIMRIDPRDYEREVEKLIHELEVMKAKHVYLIQEYERMAHLIKNNATSRTLFESAVSAKDASMAEIKSKETSLKIAQDKLADTKLIAPFPGRIIQIGIEKYEMAKSGEIVVSLQNLEKLDVVVNIPEGNIPELSRLGEGGLVGKSYPVSFPGRQITMEAKISEFSPVASAENGTYELRLAMTQPKDFMIFPGMTVEVRELPGRLHKLKSQSCIPFSAVFCKNNRSMVWQFDPELKKISPVEIKCGEIYNDMIETSSLQAGCYIVGAGGDWLTDGMAITVLNPEVFHESN